MSDFMKWFFIHYIKPYVESQPKGGGETMQFSLLAGDLYPEQEDLLEAAAAHTDNGQRTKGPS